MDLDHFRAVKLSKDASLFTLRMSLQLHRSNNRIERHFVGGGGWEKVLGCTVFVGG